MTGIASAEIRLPEEFLLKVSRLGDQTDAIIEKALVAGGKVVLGKVRGNLRAVVGKGTKLPSRSTGELESALGLSPVKVNWKGNHDIKVGFNEPRRRQYTARGKRSYYTATNAMIANVLEYGKHNQPPKPFLKPAKSTARKPCQEEMRRTLEEEIERV